MLKTVDAIGSKVLGLVRYTWFLLAFLYLAVKMLWVGRHLGQRDLLRQVLMQVYFTAVQAIGPIVVLALAVGVFAIVEGVGGIGTLSGADNLGRMITVVVLREVAPLLTGVVVIVRSVTAIAAELGSMRVHREVEALEVMGIAPIRFLVTPRLIGGLLSLFGLTVLFAATALLGGFVIAQLLVKLPANVFFDAVLSATRPADLGMFLIKVCVGGVGLVLIGCYHGLDVVDSPTEVPVAVSRAALNSLIFLVLLNGAVSVANLAGRDPTSLLLGGLP
ncbi:MAG: ABC transporter permease [Deltaproteobacteria bacterium]|nr:ABC transporter permease [Deltaproteobacteria bacterium]